MAEFITDPIVVTVLLTIAGMAMVLELFSPRMGLPGLVGLSALLVFFYGHFMAGLAGFGTLALFVAGIVLIFMEFFLPGAVAGTLGIAALVGSLFLAGGSTFQMGVSLLISIFFSIVFFILLIKVFHKKMALFNSMVLFDTARKEDGYVSNINRTDLLGKEGVAMTVLRPSGTALFNNERIDVVTEGAFIKADARVMVIEVEGPRVVVREIKN
ncbi:nodulation efficiency protein NfeD [Neobacillus notoginsengisoli]|uniref:Nodulation efficiency protein NfeD n=1 Tax=Neobacillus notoginsengisoli TaxID=1578198 RepID=A0A417YUV7_9BACI|nr:NfeD family protein [Neobacillus notoginsengisoli]RHW41015.1 nodulation efficiency protein NfeD [Neobacillus notoginsengisoli]